MKDILERALASVPTGLGKRLMTAEEREVVHEALKRALMYVTDSTRPPPTPETEARMWWQALLAIVSGGCGGEGEQMCRRADIMVNLYKKRMAGPDVTPGPAAAACSTYDGDEIRGCARCGMPLESHGVG